MSTIYAAHIVTEEASLGDPEIIIMTPDEGMGSEVIERYALSPDFDLNRHLRSELLAHSYRPTSDPAVVSHGYVIVSVEHVDD